MIRIPIRKHMQRVAEFARPTSELTGDAVSRAAAEIERELNKGDHKKVPVKVGLAVQVDEVRLFSNGVDQGFRVAVTPTVLHPGQRVSINLKLDIT